MTTLNWWIFILLAFFGITNSILAITEGSLFNLGVGVVNLTLAFLIYKNITEEV